MPQYSEGVRYIKIAKKDKNGVDQTNTLQSLTEITIPFSTGNITYNVISISEKPTYFLYSVPYSPVGWADRADIEYAYSGGLNAIPATFGSPPVVNPRQLPFTTITDNQSFIEDYF